MTREVKKIPPARRAAVVVRPQQEPVTTKRLRAGGSLLCIEPATEDVDLLSWCEHNRPTVEAMLSRHGALLFRGFGMDAVERFESFASSVCPDLFEENGEHPRRSISGRVYTPVFYPPTQRLLWHNENSFNQRWPMKIMFACVKPADAGGGTPVVDSRKVYELLDPEVRRRFESKHVMYVRNYGSGLGLKWSEVFRTESRAEVEAECKRTGVEFEWKDGGRLRTRCVRPAVVRHPRTGEPVWFAQAQHWHVSCLDPQTRESLQSILAEEDWPRHCYYGDGGTIADEEMREVLSAYKRLEESFAWERGDVLLLDNLLMAHGREPYEGERKLLVAMGEMASF
jgi:alpha-ketoglutarate-dependent taurine dioxygenase